MKFYQYFDFLQQNHQRWGAPAFLAKNCRGCLRKIGQVEGCFGKCVPRGPRFVLCSAAFGFWLKTTSFTNTNTVTNYHQSTIPWQTDEVFIIYGRKECMKRVYFMKFWKHLLCVIKKSFPDAALELIFAFVVSRSSALCCFLLRKMSIGKFNLPVSFF